MGRGSIQVRGAEARKQELYGREIGEWGVEGVTQLGQRMTLLVLSFSWRHYAFFGASLFF